MTEELPPKQTIESLAILLKIDGKVYPVPIRRELASLILTFLKEEYPEGIPVIEEPIEGVDIP